MGSGASTTAAPHDVVLLEACINSLQMRMRDSAATILGDLQGTFLRTVPDAKIDDLLPILEAAVYAYLEQRAEPHSKDHIEARDIAVLAAGGAFSTLDDSDSPPQFSTPVPRIEEPTPAAPASPVIPSPTDATSAMARRRAQRMGGEAAPKAKVAMLVASRSTFEEAEIGGGTTYTTELTLFEGGTCEVEQPPALFCS